MRNQGQGKEGDLKAQEKEPKIFASILSEQYFQRAVLYPQLIIYQQSINPRLIDKFIFSHILMRRNQPVTSAHSGPKFNPRDYARPGVSEQQIIEIKEAFDLFDPEGNGHINSKDLKSSIDALGFEAKNNTVYQLIIDMDADGAGTIEFQDFIHLMTSKVTEEDSRNELRKVFALFDDEKTGYISIKNLRRIVRELGDTVEEFELQEMIDRADTDKDGLINEEEFYRIITRKVQ